MVAFKESGGEVEHMQVAMELDRLVTSGQTSACRTEKPTFEAR